jgi:hypothetical protein
VLNHDQNAQPALSSNRLDSQHPLIPANVAQCCHNNQPSDTGSLHLKKTSRLTQLHSSMRTRLSNANFKRKLLHTLPVTATAYLSRRILANMAHLSLLPHYHSDHSIYPTPTPVKIVIDRPPESPNKSCSSQFKMSENDTKPSETETSTTNTSGPTYLDPRDRESPTFFQSTAGY